MTIRCAGDPAYYDYTCYDYTRYAAPEILRQRTYSSAVDLWSLGKYSHSKHSYSQYSHNTYSGFVEPRRGSMVKSQSVPGALLKLGSCLPSAHLAALALGRLGAPLGRMPGRWAPSQNGCARKQPPEAAHPAAFGAAGVFVFMQLRWMDR